MFLVMVLMGKEKKAFRADIIHSFIHSHSCRVWSSSSYRFSRFPFFWSCTILRCIIQCWWANEYEYTQ